MVFPVHNNPMSDTTALHYSSTALSKYWCYISKLWQWDLGNTRNSVPAKPIRCFYTHYTGVYQSPRCRGGSPHKTNSRRPVSYQHTTSQSKNQNHTKSPQTPTCFIPISPLHIHRHTHLGCSCISFLSWMCRPCCNYLTPNNLQLVYGLGYVCIHPLRLPRAGILHLFASAGHLWPI